MVAWCGYGITSLDKALFLGAVKKKLRLDNDAVLILRISERKDGLRLHQDHLAILHHGDSGAPSLRFHPRGFSGTAQCAANHLGERLLRL